MWSVLAYSWHWGLWSYEVKIRSKLGSGFCLRLSQLQQWPKSKTVLFDQLWTILMIRLLQFLEFWPTWKGIIANFSQNKKPHKFNSQKIHQNWNFQSLNLSKNQNSKLSHFNFVKFQTLKTIQLLMLANFERGKLRFSPTLRNLNHNLWKIDLLEIHWIWFDIL